MLFLLFKLDQDRYALPANQIVEILPLVAIKNIPRAPPGVVGAFNYRGAAVPAIDLCLLCLDRPARILLSTRLIIVRLPDEQDETRHLGLIAESATGLVRREAADFSSPARFTGSAAYLGRIAADTQGLVQEIEIRELLPLSLRAPLFEQARAVAS
jgi:chemotaxis-related protein WspB